MSDISKAISEVAEALHTGTAPGKPPLPHIPTFEVGTVSAATAASATVTFPSDPALSSISLTIPYLGTQPVAGNLVLVVQLPHQRIILGVISH